MNKRRSQASFVTDDVAINFLNTAANAAGGRVDAVGDGRSFLDWLRTAGLVSEEVRLKCERAHGSAKINEAAAEARALRTWLRGFVDARGHERPRALKASQLEPLNRILRRGESFEQIVVHLQGGVRAREAPLVRELRERLRSPHALLVPVARSIAKLVCGDQFADVRTCNGGGCTLMFIDRTRARRRQWCSMSTCGNRAKVRAHRNRKVVDTAPTVGKAF